MPKLMCEAKLSLYKLQAIWGSMWKPSFVYPETIQRGKKQVVIGETDIYEARCRHCYEGPN
ncbi:MAG: hypothetical protein Ct9H300mP18_11750 [Candidatus Neomarinimicrobiota bacterium]|nr:MAG: hypothetical protein Ct9H300mP18_11750 [Candidatus Neomarinimicrobiota bacterium]